MDLFRSTAIDVSGEFVEGKQYKVIDSATAGAVQRSDPGHRILLLRLRPLPQLRPDRRRLVEQRAEGRPVRTQSSDVLPVAGACSRSRISRSRHPALEENHERIFTAIHDNGKQFLTLDTVADFVKDHGVTRDPVSDGGQFACYRALGRRGQPPRTCVADQQRAIADRCRPLRDRHGYGAAQESVRGRGLLDCQNQSRPRRARGDRRARFDSDPCSPHAA